MRARRKWALTTAYNRSQIPEKDTPKKPIGFGGNLSLSEGIERMKKNLAIRILKDFEA